MEKLNKDASIALYQQLADMLKEQINSGKLSAGDRLMTEKELSKKYGISRITVRKAIEVLVEEEILIKKQGIGTFVAEKKLIRNTGVFMGFSRGCVLDGKVPGAILLSAELARAEKSDLKNLKVSENEKVIKIRRVRTMDGVPVLIEENRFSQKYAYLFGENLENSIYDILEKHGVTLSGGVRKVSICTSTKEESQLLEIKENVPLLYMQDVCVGADGEIIHSCKSVINPERYELIINTLPDALTEK